MTGIEVAKGVVETISRLPFAFFLVFLALSFYSIGHHYGYQEAYDAAPINQWSCVGKCDKDGSFESRWFKNKESVSCQCEMPANENFLIQK